MSAIDFVRTYVKEWVVSKDHIRNILIVGDVDERKMKELIKNVSQNEIMLVPGRKLKEFGDLGKVLGGMQPSQLLIISRLEDMAEAALDSFVGFFAHQQNGVKKNYPEKDTNFTRQKTSLICTIDSSCTISRTLFEAFEIKVLLGHDIQVSIANEDEADGRPHEFLKEMAYSHSGSLDFTVVSFEMPIILRIDSYLSENPEWYRNISYVPPDDEGGVYSVIVDGANDDLAKAIFKKFSGIGQFAVQHKGKVLFGSI